MKGDLGVERERETDDERQARLVNTKLRPMIFFIQTDWLGADSTIEIAEFMQIHIAAPT